MVNFKFRAWHEGAKQMLQSHDQGYQGEVFKWVDEGQPVKIMQFTGLLDKDAQEIYVGDIVEGCRAIKDRIGVVIREDRFLGAVEYDAWWGSFRRNGVKQYQGISAELMHGKEMKVIGNIYEHKHLLDNK